MSDFYSTIHIFWTYISHSGSAVNDTKFYGTIYVPVKDTHSILLVSVIQTVLTDNDTTYGKSVYPMMGVYTKEDVHSYNNRQDLKYAVFIQF